MVSPAAPSVQPVRFVREAHALDGALRDAKQQQCPRCRRFSALIGHGFLVGYAEHTNDLVVRGRRLLCSNRGRRGGCGRTVSLRIASELAGFSARTWALSRLMLAAISGVSLRATWTQHVASPLSLRSGYRLHKRLLKAQAHLRTTLSTASPPPDCDGVHPLSQVLSHLHQVLGSHECVLSRFQLRFQRHLLS